MLRTELLERIPIALKDDEGPWKLLAYLDQIQPPIHEYTGLFHPSYTMRMMMDEVRGQLKQNSKKPDALRSVLLDLAARALQEERVHLMESIGSLIEKTEETIDQQDKERSESVDAYLEGLEDSPTDENGQPRRPQTMVEELAAMMHLSQLRLNPENMRLLLEDPKELSDPLHEMIHEGLLSLSASRVIGAVERRLGEELGFKSNQFQGQEWEQISSQIVQAVETVLDRQTERLLGANGAIAREIEPVLEDIDEEDPDDEDLMMLLGMMAQGSRVIFDRRTHRQGVQRTIRLNYIYLASKLIPDRDPRDVAEDVLEHLQGARAILVKAGGRIEFMRLAQAGATLRKFDERWQERIKNALGDQLFEAIADQPMISLPEEQRALLYDDFGWPMQNETYRRMLLSVISELWVDYLTSVEGLRVSIGLESYAQRDPLVQYKSKASEMFGELLADIRRGVIARMFLYRPQAAPTAALQRQEDTAAPASETDDDSADRKKKRRRH